MHRTRYLQIIQSNALPAELSPQRGNERHNIRVGYISFLAHLTLKEVEVDSEYHAPRRYRFIVFFMLALDQ